ncbi:MAG: hypothetical protein ACJA16_003138, partial [Akkermansiaceae bacterium]
GHQEGLQNSILRALELRFGCPPVGLAAAIREVHDDSVLDGLLKASIESSSLEEFSQVL